MTPLALFAELERRGVRIHIEAGRLRWRAPNGAMTPVLARELQLHKPALLALLAPPESRVTRPPDFSPLDGDIAQSEAIKWRAADTAVRLARLEVQALSSTATDLDRCLAADWRAVLTAKLDQEQSAIELNAESGAGRWAQPQAS